MPKKLFVTLVVTLPADPFEAGAIYTHLQPAWATLLEALKGCSAPYDVKFQEMEQRTKAPRGPRRPRGVVQAPSLVPPPEAA